MRFPNRSELSGQFWRKNWSKLGEFNHRICEGRSNHFPVSSAGRGLTYLMSSAIQFQGVEETIACPVLPPSNCISIKSFCFWRPRKDSATVQILLKRLNCQLAKKLKTPMLPEVWDGEACSLLVELNKY